MDKQKQCILLAAGGTGGHMSPAQALAEDLTARGYKVVLATDKRGMRFAPNFKDIEIKTVKSATLSGSIIKRMSGGAALAQGYAQSFLMLNKLKPAVVVGFGGYPSLPVVLAAQNRRIPTAIHEANATLGRANKFLAPHADRIALSWPKGLGIHESDEARTIVTGNPVRKDIARLFSESYPQFDADTDLNLVVFGGSLGATVLSEVVPKALASLPDDKRDRLNIIQQCRGEDLGSVKAVYKSARIKAAVVPYIDDMAEALKSAHLVIGRSGASTVAELAAIGRPAVFVPLTLHADDQQTHNAKAIRDVGGGWMIPEKNFTPVKLADLISEVMERPSILFNAAEAARSAGRPDAARLLGNVVTALASGWDKEAFRPFDLTQGIEG